MVVLDICIPLLQDVDRSTFHRAIISAKEHADVPIRWILVNNANAENFAAAKEFVEDDQIMITDAEEPGFEAGINSGLRFAKSKLFAALSPYCLLETKNWVSKVLRPFGYSRNCFMLSSALSGIESLRPAPLTNRSEALPVHFCVFSAEGLKFYGGLQDMEKLQKKVLHSGWSVWRDDSIRASLVTPSTSKSKKRKSSEKEKWSGSQLQIPQT
jgi:hypothetical protein